MSIDMSQFFQVFFEEAAEHLASMESLLLGIDLGNPDPEELNAIFRAAHSIKGSSGTFGFQDLAEVTHELETLLDQVRKGETTLTADMVDAFLQSGDVLNNLLAAHRGEDEADTAAASAICARLQGLYSGRTAQITVSAGGKSVAETLVLEVRFVPDAMCHGKPAVLSNMLGELSALGEVEVLVEGTSAAPGWVLRLKTEAGPDAVEGIVDFVAAPGTLDVRLEQALADDAEGAYGFFDAAEPVAPPVAEKAYGFFDPVPAAPAEGRTDAGPREEAYGFFEPVALPQPPAPAVEAEDGSYGLFEPVGAPVQAPVLAGPEGELPIIEGPGYGLYPERLSSDGPAKASPAPLKVVESTPAKAGGGAPKPAAGKGAADSSIRVSVEKVDQMINLVGELVITQAMLAQSATRIDPVVHERLLDGIAQLQRNTRDLQESVMSIRMMPISMVFSRFPRVVRDVSQKLGKQVRLILNGEGTELDKSLIEKITDPLTHLVRNSLDHGIEAPAARKAKGKPEEGTITLTASHQSGNIVIEVGDDGNGLNRDKILAKARERGLPLAENMSDAEVWQLIFEPGFSTADQITEVSGRGVGMDVVKKNITALGGRVDIESMAGIGTRITVRLPLTLAILDGMSVAVGAETYIMPLNYVVESLQPTRAMIKSVAGAARLLHVRGEYLPLVPLHEVFNVQPASTDLEQGIVVILESDGIKAALLVDTLVGQHQVVIKSLEANYRRVAGISGATIMGDGRVALILDVPALVSMARRELPAAA